MFKNENWKLIIILALYALICCTADAATQTYDRELHWCIKNFTKAIKTTKQISERIEIKRWCWPQIRCKFFEFKPKIINVTEEVLKQKKECCEGYIETNHICEPVCKPRCINGECVSPNKCNCYGRFSGPTCEIGCEDNKWGPGCINICTCQNNGVCEVNSGKCDCQLAAGWIGEHCEIQCPEGTYGSYCSNKCKCQNSGTCDHITGNCTCTENWTGHRCETSLNISNLDECNCGKWGSCTAEGKCICNEGWTGEKCDACITNKWGEDCSKTCDCISVNSCDKNTGICNCPNGFYGKNCILCPDGTFGLDCKNICRCQNEAKCNHINGDCKCKPGWMGKFCEKTCPDTGEYRYWGENCENLCSCLYGKCNRTTGYCTCYPGFRGVNCNEKCENGFFGENCSRTCDCVKGICNSFSGTCSCNDGYKGIYCSEPICPDGQHLENDKCDNNVSIDYPNFLAVILPVCIILIIVVIIGIIYLCKFHTSMKHFIDSILGN